MKPARLLKSSAFLSVTGVMASAWGQAPAPAGDSEPAALAPAPPPQPAPAAPPADLPPPPPPRGDQPPPGPEGKMVISAPALPLARARRGYHVHDGFYLRLGAGIGMGRASIDSDSAASSSFALGGAGPAFDLWIGGTPWSGVAIGGLISVRWLRDSDVAVDGDSSDEGMDGRTGMLGVFLDAFPDPQRGLHFGGALGVAGLTANADGNDLENRWRVTDYDAGGLGLSAWVGYMGFVGPEWSMGGLLQLSGAVTRKSERNLTRDGSSGMLTLSFSALYH